MRFCFLALILSINGIFSNTIQAAQPPEHVVYGVYRGINLGNPGEMPPKDFYISMGSAHGIHRGTILQVMRKLSTFDVVNSQFYQDVTFPIAEIKVIHAERNASIARLEKMLPMDKTPTLSPQAVMAGDLVQTIER